MSIDLRDSSPPGPGDFDVEELVATLRPRLVGAVGDADVDALVREEYAGLGPVRVTTYLPILVERRVRARVRPHGPQLSEPAVTA